MRFFLACLLLAPAKAGASSGIRGLLSSLDSAPPEERPLILRALGKSNRKRALERLLLEFDPDKRPAEETGAAAAALGDLGYEEAVPVLAKAFERMADQGFARGNADAPAAAARAEVLSALSRLGGPPAKAAVRRGLLDSDGGVQRAALGAVQVLKEKESFRFVERLAGSADEETARAAYLALGALGGPDAERILRAGLKASGARKAAAACGLMAMGESAGELALHGFFEEEADPNAAGLAAAGCLARFGKTRGIDFLARAAEGRSEHAAAAVVELGRSREPRAVLPLAKFLLAEEASKRMTAAVAIGEIGGERALYLLGKLSGDNNPAVREAARRARASLGEYDPPSRP